jgi:SAM-dependent methyltransferase
MKLTNNEEKPNCTLLARDFGYRSLKRYETRSQFLFSGLQLKGKRLLEIGCGYGAFCVWAAIKGADYVLGIEPEAEGSTSGSSECFLKVIKKYSLKNTEFKSCILKELPVPEQKFDIILLYNVINHLHEESVQFLLKSKQAYDVYLKIIMSLKEYIHKDSVLIIADCGRTNFWNMIGLKSPFAPTIEWDKHQNPNLWIQLFQDAGLKLKDYRWSPMYPLGKLSSNWLAHYLTQCHFVLRFQL